MEFLRIAVLTLINTRLHPKAPSTQGSQHAVDANLPARFMFFSLHSVAAPSIRMVPSTPGKKLGALKRDGAQPIGILLFASALCLVGSTIPRLCEIVQSELARIGIPRGVTLRKRAAFTRGNASTASAPVPDNSSRCPDRRACRAAPASSRKQDGRRSARVRE